jgi:hypothetical protein
MIKISIQEDDKEPIILEFDEAEIHIESGVGCYYIDSSVPTLTHNGQQRLMLTAWSKCASYDSFESYTTKNKL